MKKLLIMAAIAAAAYVPASSYLWQPEPLIAYQAEVDSGDTVWTICAKIASEADNMEEGGDRTMLDSGISDAGNVQPGSRLIVKVKPRK